MIKEFEKGNGVQLSAHFRSNEFDCHCKYLECTKTLVNTDLIEQLEKVRTLLDCSLLVVSGFRCGQYQLDLKSHGFETAVNVSQHELGNAADFLSGAHDGVTLAKAAKTAGFQAIGVAKKWIHVDLRVGTMRNWNYNN